MPFPETQRIVFKRNPLTKVICQLRFPTILRIESEVPVQFQEKVREHYPELIEKQNTSSFPDLENAPLEFKQILSQLVPNITPQKRSYEFISEDGHWAVGLSSNSISLTTTDYTRWEQFNEYLEIPFNALKEIYSPAFFNRIGLRYINVIQREMLEAPSEIHWTELLQPYILGALAEENVAKNVEEHVGQTLINLTGTKGKVRVHFGLGKDDQGRAGYLIDNDFFVEERVRVDEADEYLHEFNRRSGRLFQWVITEKLRQLLIPEPITE